MLNYLFMLIVDKTIDTLICECTGTSVTSFIHHIISHMHLKIMAILLLIDIIAIIILILLECKLSSYKKQTY